MKGHSHQLRAVEELAGWYFAVGTDTGWTFGGDSLAFGKKNSLGSVRANVCIGYPRWGDRVAQRWFLG